VSKVYPAIAVLDSNKTIVPIGIEGRPPNSKFPNASAACSCFPAAGPPPLTLRVTVSVKLVEYN
jgi:hypothetical protein